MTVEIELKIGRTIELSRVIFVMKRKEGIFIDYYNEEIDQDIGLVTTLKIKAEEIENIEIVEF